MTHVDIEKLEQAFRTPRRLGESSSVAIPDAVGLAICAEMKALRDVEKEVRDFLDAWKGRAGRGSPSIPPTTGIRAALAKLGAP